MVIEIDNVFIGHENNISQFCFSHLLDKILLMLNEKIKQVIFNIMLLQKLLNITV